MIRRFDANDPTELANGIKAATAAVRRGEVVIVPTESSYGLATDPFRADGLAKLRSLKDRGPELPIPVMVASAATAAGVLWNTSLAARELMAAFWPGALTLVGAYQPSLMWDVAGSTEQIVSIRVPLHPVAWQLTKSVGPLALTGANISGAQVARSFDQAVAQFGEAVSVYLDAGTCQYAQPSSVVDVSSSPPYLVRAGAIGTGDLQRICPELVVA